MVVKNKWYETKLKDRRWQEKKHKVLERDGWKCQLDYKHKGTLMIHHKNYKSGKDPWEYPMKDLIILCESCHSKFHGKKSVKEKPQIKIKQFKTDACTAKEKKDRISAREKFFAKFK